MTGTKTLTLETQPEQGAELFGTTCRRGAQGKFRMTDQPVQSPVPGQRRTLGHPGTKGDLQSKRQIPAAMLEHRLMGCGITQGDTRNRDELPQVSLCREVVGIMSRKALNLGQMSRFSSSPG